MIGRVDEKYTVTIAPGRRAVRLDAQLAALARRTVVSRRLERRSIEVLAFSVPKAGSSAKISLLAASRATVAATGV